jgi:hypothetical protein
VNFASLLRFYVNSQNGKVETKPVECIVRLSFCFEQAEIMGRPRKLTHAAPMELKDVVTVAYVEDMDLAEQYRYLLLENSIPVVIQKMEPTDKTRFSNIALQVPEEFLESAYNLLTQQAVVDDFFSAVFGSDDNSLLDETDTDGDE